MKEKIRRIYLKYKNTKYFGFFLVCIRNIIFSDFIQGYRLKRKDFEKAKELAWQISKNPKELIMRLEIFRKSEIFKRRFSFGHAGDFDVYTLYLIIREIRPEIVVETGIASGRSSTAILQALHENNRGQLYSIDLPKYYEGKNPGMYKTGEGNNELLGFVPAGREPGWLVPDYLRYRWQTIFGDSKTELPRLLEKLKKIDIFYHDSEHSYECMNFEFNLVWPNLRSGGYLLSDDIKWNSAFSDFVFKVKPVFNFTYRNLGIVRKG